MPGILAVWDAEGWKKPEVSEQFNPDRTILTLSLAKGSDKKASTKSGDKKVSIKSGDKEVKSKTIKNFRRILSLMETGREYRVDDFCAPLNLKPTRVRVLLRELLAQGKLEARGSNRNRTYLKVSKAE